MIQTITLTGADDNTNYEMLNIIHKRFPFVEFGILASPDNFGKVRFPSREWISGLTNYSREFNLSLHLCGKYAKEFILGHNTVCNEIPEFDFFKRVQLNIGSFDPAFNAAGLCKLIEDHPDQEFIFQHSEKSAKLINSISLQCKNISILYDKSGGRGVLPSDWPVADLSLRSGYAGGLNPDNLSEQIKRINFASFGSVGTWIDIESGLRSEGFSGTNVFSYLKSVMCAKTFKALCYSEEWN